MKHRCNVLFYLKRGALLKSGDVPIMGRISIDGCRAQFSTRLALPPKAWDVAQNRAVGRSLEMVRINRELDRLGVTADRLTSEERLKIITALESNGIFLLKGAVKDVAAGLCCSQASVYRYLSQVKNDNT